MIRGSVKPADGDAYRIEHTNERGRSVCYWFTLDEMIRSFSVIELRELSREMPVVRESRGLAGRVLTDTYRLVVAVHQPQLF